MPSSHEPFTAHTPAQARLLLDLSYHGLLERLMRQEASVGEVARTAKITVKQAHHKVIRLLSAGLIEVCGERPRGGRPIKLYRAVAGAYRVPFALTDAATFEELLSRIQQPILTAHYQALGELMTRQVGGDFLLELEERGGLRAHFEGPAPDDQRPEVAFSSFVQYPLAPHTIKELEKRLKDLLDCLEQEATTSEQGGQPHVLGLLLTPGRLEGA